MKFKDELGGEWEEIDRMVTMCENAPRASHPKYCVECAKIAETIIIRKTAPANPMPELRNYDVIETKDAAYLLEDKFARYGCEVLGRKLGLLDVVPHRFIKSVRRGCEEIWTRK